MAVLAAPPPPQPQAHKTFLTAPFFTFHQANGFEADGQIHVDLAYYDDPQVTRGKWGWRLWCDEEVVAEVGGGGRRR